MTLEKTIFGKYKLVSPISQKKQAETWLAQHGRHNTQVVVKLIPILPGPEQSSLTRCCFQEFKAVSKLYHSAIMPVFDYGSANNYIYIIRPYLKGGNLAMYLEREAPALPVLLKLFQTMLEGL